MKQLSTAKITILLFLVSTVLHSRAHFFSDFYDNYIKHWVSETKQETYQVEDANTLVVEIPRGTIKITGWDGKNIEVTTCKHAPAKEHLTSIVLKKTKESKTLKLHAQFSQPTTKGIMDVELLVPKNLHISLATQQGNIHAKNLGGMVTATTQQGAIQAKDIRGNLIAHAEQGNIIVKKAQNHVKATTHTGNITIYDAQKNIIASTHTGSIDTRFKQLDTRANVQLSSTSGNITLGLPEGSNADVYAKTEKGQLTCEHFITTKPQTMQLNTKNWQRQKREVNGLIGSGEANIKMTSVNSSIKIINLSEQEITA
ncbi:DUF4097 family beta strand repeat protein [Candidatus Dependentiae bacterium]|nr:DUF4097 family beta strand repeat protein [Candidatus Dependentiae bacterium]